MDKRNNYRNSNQKRKENDVLSITSIHDLEKYSQGTIVQLPDFAEGQPFIARLRRPSMLALAKSGKIPNSLLQSAGELFNGNIGSSNGVDRDILKEMYEIMRIIAGSSLIEPTLEQIEQSGITLTDEQMMAIFNYSQQGIKSLEGFRSK